MRMARQVMIAEWAEAQPEEALDMAALTAFAAALDTPELSDEVAWRADQLRSALPQIDQSHMLGEPQATPAAMEP
jgi:hypothetical protein